MGKIKAWYRSIPIWLAFILIALAGLGASAFLADRVTGAKYYELVQLKSSTGYISAGSSGSLQEWEEAYNVTAPAGTVDVQISSGGSVTQNQYWTEIDALPQNIKAEYRYTMTEAKLVPVLIYISGLLLASMLFWFTKLRKPLRMLEAASERIAANELDFSLDYPGLDEMARLCAAFERMRSALDENNRRMLRMIDEQHQLNDAYTHDLRTPIAVLKGYTDTLTEYLPTGRLPRERVLETVHTMSAHVERLEQFVNSMNTAQKLADLTIRRESVPAGDFVKSLRETTALLCEKQELSCHVTSDIEAGTLNIDPGAVTQVYENLLGNALRFAKTQIDVRLESDGEALTLRVADDGRGFKDKELVSAAKPYFSGEQVEKTYHFGLGLYICQTICEKHGGGLELANAEDGGAVVTARFSL